jgi:hypothetical protein
MYHISNLKPNALAAKFADINGYVPEAGDNWRDMNYDFGSDCPLRAKRKVEEAEDELSEIEAALYCADDEDEINAMERRFEEIEQELYDLKSDFDNIINCLDTEWWPDILRDAIAATAEDNRSLSMNFCVNLIDEETGELLWTGHVEDLIGINEDDEDLEEVLMNMGDEAHYGNHIIRRNDD